MLIKSFSGLSQQLFEKPFKNMLYTIYNFAEDERYTDGLRRLGYDDDIDSLEFAVLDLVDGVNIKLFKEYIETELQKGDVIIGILLFKGKKGLVPIAIKPKGVNISTILKQS